MSRPLPADAGAGLDAQRERIGRTEDGCVIEVWDPCVPRPRRGNTLSG